MSAEKRPPIASGLTDAESGAEGEDRRRALFALDAMLKRGLIDPAEYARRKAAIEAAREE